MNLQKHPVKINLLTVYVFLGFVRQITAPVKLSCTFQQEANGKVPLCLSLAVHLMALLSLWKWKLLMYVRQWPQGWDRKWEQPNGKNRGDEQSWNHWATLSGMSSDITWVAGLSVRQREGRILKRRRGAHEKGASKASVQLWLHRSLLGLERAIMTRRRRAWLLSLFQFCFMGPRTHVLFCFYSLRPKVSNFTDGSCWFSPWKQTLLLVCQSCNRRALVPANPLQQSWCLCVSISHYEVGNRCRTAPRLNFAVC